MTAAWSKNPIATRVCPEPLREAVLQRVAKIDGWSPWAKGTLPSNPYIVMAPSACPEKRPAPDGWCYLGEWEPEGEIYALRSHFPDGDSAWVLYCGKWTGIGQVDLVALGDVLL